MQPRPSASLVKLKSKFIPPLLSSRGNPQSRATTPATFPSHHNKKGKGRDSGIGLQDDHDAHGDARDDVEEVEEVRVDERVVWMVQYRNHQARMHKSWELFVYLSTSFL